jgi:RNA polymerase sigma-70 factor (ECF subfamily)
MSRPTDEELMAQYQQGDVAAFDLLYLRYGQRLYNFLLRLVRDRERCAELFQETFLQLHQGRHQYDPHRPFGAWIFRIARNRAYNEFRRAKRQGQLFTGEVDEETVADSRQDNPERALHESLLRAQMDLALQALPEDQREAILLSYYGGLKYADIAGVMETTEDAIKQRVRRGMKALREKCQSFLRSE